VVVEKIKLKKDIEQILKVAKIIKLKKNQFKMEWAFCKNTQKERNLNKWGHMDMSGEGKG